MMINRTLYHDPARRTVSLAGHLSPAMTRSPVSRASADKTPFKKGSDKDDSAPDATKTPDDVEKGILGQAWDDVF